MKLADKIPPKLAPIFQGCVKGAKIFISYSSADRDFANRLSCDLQKRGFIIWIDQLDVKVGDCILTKMDQGLRDAKYVILILSQSSVSSSWVNREWKSAYWTEIENQSTKILPVLRSDCNIPFFLKTKKYADFRHTYRQGFSELITSLDSLDNIARSQKEKVWYLDDNPYWLDAFKARHKDTFEISCFFNIVDLLSSLQAVKKGTEICPDILLVDLYTPLSEFEISKDLLKETNEKTSRLFALEKELKSYVDSAWEPYGVEIVNWVRESYSFEELPITLYTQRGLVVLEDDLIMELEILGTSWLLKNQFSPETERMMLNRNMRYGINANRPGSKHILFIDDNPAFHRAFCDRHKSFYEIECATDQSEVIPIIEKMKSDGRFPNILIVDLYYPKLNKDNAKIELANKKLAEFQEFESEVKSLVREAFEPIGMRVIKEIRNLLSDTKLPILMYTQFGLLLLDDSNIRKIESLNAGWLLKDRYSIKTEQTKIMGEIILSRLRSDQIEKINAQPST